MCESPPPAPPGVGPAEAQLPPPPPYEKWYGRGFDMRNAYLLELHGGPRARSHLDFQVLHKLQSAGFYFFASDGEVPVCEVSVKPLGFWPSTTCRYCGLAIHVHCSGVHTSCGNITHCNLPSDAEPVEFSDELKLSQPSLALPACQRDEHHHVCDQLAGSTFLPVSQPAGQAPLAHVPAPGALAATASATLLTVLANPPPAPGPPPGAPHADGRLRLYHPLTLAPFRSSSQTMVGFFAGVCLQGDNLSCMAEAYRCGVCHHSGPGDISGSNIGMLRASCGRCGQSLLLQPILHDITD